MKKKLIILFIVLFCAIIAFVAVYSSRPQIVGTWRAEAAVIGLAEEVSADVVLTFNKNGTATFKNTVAGGETVNTQFKYTVNKNTLTVAAVSNAETQIADATYKYSIKKDVLTVFYGNHELKFQKAK